MHIHLGGIHALTIFFMVALVGTFWRLIALRNKDNALGQAMAFIY